MHYWIVYGVFVSILYTVVALPADADDNIQKSPPRTNYEGRPYPEERQYYPEYPDYYGRPYTADRPYPPEGQYPPGRPYPQGRPYPANRPYGSSNGLTYFLGSLGDGLSHLIRWVIPS